MPASGRTASFRVEVTTRDIDAFAALSGDHNPLHVDPVRAAAAPPGRQVLHGAFSAGLFSRLAGMELPGGDCLLASMSLRFTRPVLPPASLCVSGEIVRDNGSEGRVEARVTDAGGGILHVEGSYDFIRHMAGTTLPPPGEESPAAGEGKPETGDGSRVLVTGASGAIGRALREGLGRRALALSRGSGADLEVRDYCRLDHRQIPDGLSAIVHCAWPAPDNLPLLGLDPCGSAPDCHLTGPVRDILALARLLVRKGSRNAVLVLIGSRFARSGSHAFRSPLYSVAKACLPTLVQALALELAAGGRRVVLLAPDTLSGGMNATATAVARQMDMDRSPFGLLPSPGDIAAQILWVLENRSFLLSGASLELHGGALP